MRGEYRTLTLAVNAPAPELAALEREGWSIRAVCAAAHESVACVVLLARTVWPAPQEHDEQLARDLHALYMRTSGKLANDLAEAYYDLTGDYPIPF